MAGGAATRPLLHATLHGADAARAMLKRTCAAKPSSASKLPVQAVAAPAGAELQLGQPLMRRGSVCKRIGACDWPPASRPAVPCVPPPPPPMHRCVTTNVPPRGTSRGCQSSGSHTTPQCIDITGRRPPNGPAASRRPPHPLPRMLQLGHPPPPCPAAAGAGPAVGAGHGHALQAG